MSWVFLILAGLFEMTGVTMINSWHKKGIGNHFSC